MAKRNIRSDEDNLYQIHKKEQKEMMDADIRPPSQPDLSDNPDAQSFWSTGRNCPRCANRMTIIELNEESGVLWVQCRSCGLQMGHPDLEAQESDALFRMIPADMKLRWAQARERQLDKEGK